jgi:hypothetical protein
MRPRRAGDRPDPVAGTTGWLAQPGGDAGHAVPGLRVLDPGEEGGQVNRARRNATNPQGQRGVELRPERGGAAVEDGTSPV